jgi:two-component system cell cycle response regulator
MTKPARAPADETAPEQTTPTSPAELEQRVRELEAERRHLLAMFEILQDVAGGLNFVDIMSTITRRLGETFGLDRCSAFLSEPGGNTARLVSSYEDPSIRNYMVDLKRYPEIRRALETGETVFIADAQTDPALKHIRAELVTRNVKTITVIPITWRKVSIGALFLRTFRDGPAFTDADIQFCHVVAEVTARALRMAHRYERMVKRQSDVSDRAQRAERERVALVAYLNRLLSAFASRTGPWTDGQLGETAAEELERLVGLTMAVIEEEGKGS